MSSLGESGPKARQRCVADGEQAEIPVPHMGRTAGTRVAECEPGMEGPVQAKEAAEGESPVQGAKSVTWSEIPVTKHTGQPPRKAAIVPYAPVP